MDIAIPVDGRHRFAALRAGLARAAAGAALALAAAAALAQAGPTPAGLWKTVDDKTGQPKSLVRIVERDGVLTGRIERILTEKTDARCDRCTDERKDQPVLGMTILSGMRRNGDLWEGGKILDPNDGKVYSSLLRLDEAGRKLEVRGYVGLPMLGRSQVWLREE